MQYSHCGSMHVEACVIQCAHKFSNGITHHSDHNFLETTTHFGGPMKPRLHLAGFDGRPKQYPPRLLHAWMIALSLWWYRSSQTAATSVTCGLIRL